MCNTARLPQMRFADGHDLQWRPRRAQFQAGGQWTPNGSSQPLVLRTAAFSGERPKKQISMSVSRAITTPCLSTCPMMHPGTASCGTYDRLRIEPAHNVRLGRCFHFDRVHASYASPSMCRPWVSPPWSCCESLPGMRKSNRFFSSRTTSRSPRDGCRRSDVAVGTSSHSRRLPRHRSSWTHRRSEFPATRTADVLWRPPGTSSAFTHILTKLHAPSTPTTLESLSQIATVPQPSQARQGQLGLMSS